MTCPNCQSQSFKVLAMGLYDDESYFQKRRCFSCASIYYEIISLRNTQHVLQQKLLLSHLVYQWKTGELLSSGAIVLHINDNHRDNRPDNLHKTNGATRVTYDILKERQKQIQSQIRDIENEMAKLQPSRICPECGRTVEDTLCRFCNVEPVNVPKLI